MKVIRMLYLDEILERALQGNMLNHREVGFLLATKDPADINKVFRAAQEVRNRYFGTNVFMYGFIYFSTFCRNRCNFCFYRKKNTISPRYRKSLPEILDIAQQLAKAGVHLIDLTMGEDPLIHDEGNYEVLIDIVKGVKKLTNLPIMISPGVVPDSILVNLSKVGVDWYALYQESYNLNLYHKLRVEQSFFERVIKREKASQLGMLVEDGILLGVGETLKDRVNALFKLKNSFAQQVRVMSFVAQEQTPMEKFSSPPRHEECLSIAIMRLLMPDRLIPASLDIDGIAGLQMRLEAGANVVTSVIPPSHSLAGVSNAELDIDQGLRTPEQIKKVLASLGLQVASQEVYEDFLTKKKTFGQKMKVL